MDRMNFQSKASVQMTRSRKVESVLELDHKVQRGPELLEKLLMKGKFQVEHRDKGGKLIGIYDLPNGITNIGKNKVLDVMFNDSTPIANASWFIGLIDNASFSALAAGDTMASHAGWIEFTGYSQATRVAWGSGAASSQSTTNASPATFDITGTATLNGIFVNSIGTKGGTTGTLWATASFTSTVPVNNGDQMKITYTVSC
jgi:hypothetical protein